MPASLRAIMQSSDVAAGWLGCKGGRGLYDDRSEHPRGEHPVPTR
jgi:hypothetical protein